MATKQKSEDQQAEEIAEFVRALPQDPALQAYRVLSKLDLPLRLGAIKAIAEKLGIARFRADQAAALRAAFESNATVRAELEPLVLSGVLSVRRALTRMQPHADGRTAIFKSAGGEVARPGTGAHFAAQLSRKWQETSGADTGAKALARLRSTEKGRAALDSVRPAALPATAPRPALKDKPRSRKTK